MKIWRSLSLVCVALAVLSRVGGAASDAVTFFAIGDPQINIPKWGTAGTEQTIDAMNALPGQPFPPTMWSYDESTVDIPFDPAKAKEMLASTLATIHNERFIVRLVDNIRASIEQGSFEEFREETLGRYYAKTVAH